MTIEKLPAEVRAIVAAGWVAVVYRGLQVWGVFHQMSLAQGYVGNMTGDEGVYDRGEFQFVTTKPSPANGS